MPIEPRRRSARLQAISEAEVENNVKETAAEQTINKKKKKESSKVAVSPNESVKTRSRNAAVNAATLASVSVSPSVSSKKSPRKKGRKAAINDVDPPVDLGVSPPKRGRRVVKKKITSKSEVLEMETVDNDVVQQDDSGPMRDNNLAETTEAVAKNETSFAVTCVEESSGVPEEKVPMEIEEDKPNVNGMGKKPDDTVDTMNSEATTTQIGVDDVMDARNNVCDNVDNVHSVATKTTHGEPVVNGLERTVTRRPRRSVQPKQYKFSEKGDSTESDLSSADDSDDEEEFETVKTSLKKRRGKKTVSSSEDSNSEVGNGSEDEVPMKAKDARKRSKKEAGRSRKTPTSSGERPCSRIGKRNGPKEPVVKRYSVTPTPGTSQDLSNLEARPLSNGSSASVITIHSSSSSVRTPSRNGIEKQLVKTVGANTVVGVDVKKVESTMDRYTRQVENFTRHFSRGRLGEMTLEEVAQKLDEWKQRHRVKHGKPNLSQNTKMANEVKPKGGEGSSSSEDEWEEMELVDEDKSKKVEVEVSKANGVKVEVDWAVKWCRQEVNKAIRDNYENAHKVHILCWIYYLQLQVKRALDEGFVPSLALTLMPSGFANVTGNPLTENVAEKFAKWLHSSFKVTTDIIIGDKKEFDCRYDETARYAKCVQEKVFETDMDRAVVFFVNFSALGVPARLVVNCRTIPKKYESAEVVMKKSAETKGGAKPKKKSSLNEERDWWVEWWKDESNKWIPVDPANGEMHCEKTVEKTLSKPAIYVLACDNNLGVRDVGARYLSESCSQSYRRLRTDQNWLNKVFRCKRIRANPARARIEDLSLQTDLASRPLPAILSAYKNHPLYVLEKDLLKFEAIYPPPSQQNPIGEIRGQKIFPRSTVFTLQGDLNWIKLARSVKESEKPYKVVKARPNMRVPAEQRGEPKDLKLYGFWQTEPYKTPSVLDGKIPTNEFGNVYVYQDSMVPHGAVHLKLPGIVALCRKLNKEHAAAVVGWDFHGCSNHPIIEGACVLIEDVEELLSEWEKAEERRRAREIKKKEERVLGNWKKLIKGIMRLHAMRKAHGLLERSEERKKERADEDVRLRDEHLGEEVREENEAAWPHTQFVLHE